MTRDNSAIRNHWVLFGFIVRFSFCQHHESTLWPGRIAGGSFERAKLPADHPPLGGGAPASGNMQAEVTAQIDEARKQPEKF